MTSYYMIKKQPKIGLVLGSGGAKGLAHIGVIKTLEKNNIPIDYIAGSSIGALVGAHYAAHKDIKKLEKLALGASWRTGLKLFDPTFKGGFIEGKKIELLFEDWFHGVNFNNLKIPFVAVATDLTTGRTVNIKSGNIVKAIRASISVPAVFKPVRYQGKLLADGGLSNPLPNNVVRNMGADIVITVNLDLRRPEKNLNKKYLTLANVSMRTLNIMRYYLAKNCLKEADIIIEPKINGEIGLIGWNQFFNSHKAKQIINNGIQATKKSLPQIKKLTQNI